MDQNGMFKHVGVIACVKSVSITKQNEFQ